MRSDRVFNQSYPAVASSVPRAREALAMFAHATGANSEQVEAVRLAVSEALTNAVMHAYGTNLGAVHVSASRAHDELWVLIADDGHGVEAGYESPGLGMGLGVPPGGNMLAGFMDEGAQAHLAGSGHSYASPGTT